MKRCALVLGLATGLALPAPAFALIEIVVGPGRVGPEIGLGTEALAAANVEERVYLSNHEGTFEIYFRGGPKALNETARRFAAIPADRREIVLLPGPARPIDFDKAPIAYDWRLRLPFERPAEKTTLAIYIQEPLPPAPADPKAVRAWIADLGRDDFKTRERAAHELARLGRSAGSLLREALAAGPSAEARDRIEKLLTGISQEIRPDTLELPAGVPVVGLDDMIDRALSGKNATARSNGIWAMVRYGVTADAFAPVLEKVLKTGSDREPVGTAVWAAGWLGPGGRPLLPLLRPLEKSKDQGLANTTHQAIDQIERAKPVPMSEAETRTRATIRADIRELVEKQRREASPR